MKNEYLLDQKLKSYERPPWRQGKANLEEKATRETRETRDKEKASERRATSR